MTPTHTDKAAAIAYWAMTIRRLLVGAMRAKQNPRQISLPGARRVKGGKPLRN